MNPICFYHKADLDGVCSGAIVRHFVPNCELMGFDYGEKFPWDKLAGPERRTVYLVDLSLPPGDMQKLDALAELVWIDHHLTAITACQGLLITGVRDTRHAACELCWEWFGKPRGQEATPKAVWLLGRYGVADRGHPEYQSNILSFQYGCRAEDGIYDPTCYKWARLFHDVPNEIAAITEVGTAILRYQSEVNSRALAAGAYETKIEDFWIGPNQMFPRALACNTIIFNSQFFDGRWDPERHDVMVAYCQLGDGRWKVSMYTHKPEVDCGAICKVYGGGGHRGAAGFICDRLPWEVPNAEVS